MAGIEQPLEFWLQDLERRNNLVKPEHTMRGFFFKGVLENLRTLGDEALVKRCVEASGQEHFVDFFSYPVHLMFPILSTALPSLATRYGGAETALRQLGRRASTDFLESVAGKALLLLAQGRPKTLINSLPGAFTVAMSHGRGTVQWTGPQQGRLRATVSSVPPPFHEGMVQQVLEAVRARDIQVAGHDAGGLDVECDFSWK
ncbi:TIGR02265 family protein [Archangium sp.]|uniref:TIGR02265 family protein n=1 Tax=Archangium sp. TaxID=1872627 RepID=UPI00389A7684